MQNHIAINVFIVSSKKDLGQQANIVMALFHYSVEQTVFGKYGSIIQFCCCPCNIYICRCVMQKYDITSCCVPFPKISDAMNIIQFYSMAYATSYAY